MSGMETEGRLDTIAGRLRPNMVSRVLLWAIIGFFGLFLLWAMLTELERTVHGLGRVVPTAQLQVVSNLEGGIVEAILVKSGAQVRAGAPLIQLDTTASGAEFGSNSSALGSLSVKVARLEAEMAGTTPRFPVVVGQDMGQVAIERSLYMSRQSELSALLNAANARLSQTQRAVAEAQANVAARQTARDSAIQQADLLRPLVARGIEPQISLMQADRTAAIARSEYSSAVAAVARAQAGVSEAYASLAQARQEWRARAAQELATTQAELMARSQALPALQDRVDRTIVKAPLAGQVNRVLVATVGGSVRPGDPLVEIVPSDTGLTIEAQITPDDIAFVRMGQRALVKLTAYDYTVYGGLEGKVVGISPDAIVNERTGDTFYTVRVLTQGAQLKDAAGRQLAVTPGMVADVNLLGDKRSILAYLLTPITRLSESAFRER